MGVVILQKRSGLGNRELGRFPSQGVDMAADQARDDRGARADTDRAAPTPGPGGSVNGAAAYSVDRSPARKKASQMSPVTAQVTVPSASDP